MPVKVIPTPIPEVADRYTIACLKRDRIAGSPEEKAEFQRQVDYYAEGLDHHNLVLMQLVGELHEINGRLWNAEREIRAGLTDDLSDRQLIERTILVRDINIERSHKKNEIVELTGDGFIDTKTDYGMDRSEKPSGPGT